MTQAAKAIAPASITSATVACVLPFDVNGAAALLLKALFSSTSDHKWPTGGKNTSPMIAERSARFA